jgi:demethylmenaquinone methyltransferase/2-methoxy-6-polyprenyl-1,4-benzoquinol methylase
MPEITPYKDSNLGKKEQVAKMFDNISGGYDGMNRVISFGIDVKWRKKVLKLVAAKNPETVLDIATGTGDLAILMAESGAKKITGIDISDGMLDIGRKKVARLLLNNHIELLKGDSEAIKADPDTFDAITVAFGVRNFENLELGLREIKRVLKPGGMLVVLEFSKPRSFPFKQLYNFYFKSILPGVGRMVSADKAAYTYLPASVEAFPDGNDFIQVLQRVGFNETQCRTLTFGISSIYTGTK